MNLADVKKRVRATFGDESSVQVTDENIVTWVNDGQREVVSMNPELLEAIVAANTVAGQQDYVIPADVRKIRSISYKSDISVAFIDLTALSLQEFDKNMGAWDGSAYGQRDPLYYCTFANRIKLFPIPNTSIVGGLKLYYYRMPTDVTIDADVIDLPLNYHSAIVQYCLQQAYELDEDWNSVGNKGQQFTASVSGQRVQEKDHASASYQRITVLPEDGEYY